MSEPYTHISLRNGAQLYFIHTPTSPVVNIKVSFACGFLLFEKTEHHVPHMLEHLLLGGSEEFASEEELFKHFRRLGAHADASTGPEELSVIMRAPLASVVPATGALAQSIFSTSLSEAALEQEKDVLVREIYDRFDGISGQVFAGTMSRIIPEHYIEDLDGHIASVRDIQLERLQTVYAENITPSRATVIVSGSLSAADQKALRRVFETVADRATNKPVKLPHLDLQSVVQAHAHSGAFDNGYLTLSFVEKLDPKETFAQVAAKNVLDGYLFTSPSAVIPSELRSKGLIYSCDTDVIRAANLSIYTISLMADPEDLPEIIAVVTGHLARVASGDITKEDLEDVRSYVRYILPTVNETTEEYLSWYERDIAKRRAPRTVEQEMRTAEKITVAQLAKAAHSVYWSGDIYAFALGNEQSPIWSDAFQTLMQELHEHSTKPKAVEKALNEFTASAEEVYKSYVSARGERYWLWYGVLGFVSLIIALHVQYLPLIHHKSATVSMFGTMWDDKHWLWGVLFFVPLLIGLILEFNLPERVRSHRLWLAVLSTISAVAYLYGVVRYFGDVGKDNVPFFWQDFASVVHPLTFLVATPLALYYAVRQELSERRKAKNPA